MSKTAAIVLAFIGCLLFSLPMSAQFNGLLPNGNVYAGVSYAQLTNVVNKQSYRGWNGSFEALPFTRFPRVGIVLDASGFYRASGVTQYNGVIGPRFSGNIGQMASFRRCHGWHSSLKLQRLCLQSHPHRRRRWRRLQIGI